MAYPSVKVDIPLPASAAGRPPSRARQSPPGLLGRPVALLLALMPRRRRLPAGGPGDGVAEEDGRRGARQPARERCGSCRPRKRPWRARSAATGTLAADEQVVLGTKIVGRLAEISVDLGQPGQAGPADRAHRHQGLPVPPGPGGRRPQAGSGPARAPGRRRRRPRGRDPDRGGAPGEGAARPGPAEPRPAGAALGAAATSRARSSTRRCRRSRSPRAGTRTRWKRSRTARRCCSSGARRSSSRASRSPTPRSSRRSTAPWSSVRPRSVSTSPPGRRW